MLQLGSHSASKEFSENLGNTVSQTDGPEVMWPEGIVFLRDKHDESRI